MRITLRERIRHLMPRRFMPALPKVILALYVTAVLSIFLQGTLSRYLASADLGGAADIAPWLIEGPPEEENAALDYVGFEQMWKYNNSAEDIKHVILFRDDSEMDVPIERDTGKVVSGVTTDFNFYAYDFRLSKPYNWASHKLDEAAVAIPEVSQFHPDYGYPLHEKNHPWNGAGYGVPKYMPPSVPLTLRVPWSQTPVSAQGDLIFLRNLPFYNTYYFTSETLAARVNGEYDQNGTGDFFGGYDGVVWAQNFEDYPGAQTMLPSAIEDEGMFPSGVMINSSGSIFFGALNTTSFPQGGKQDAADPAMVLDNGERLAFQHPETYEDKYPAVLETSWAIEFDFSFGASSNAVLSFYPYRWGSYSDAVNISGMTANNGTGGGFSFMHSGSSSGTISLSTRITHWDNLSDGGRWNHARLEVQGRRLTGYINGREVFCIINMHVPTGPYSLGFEALGGSVAIDNVIIYDLYLNAMDQYEQNIPLQAGGYYKTAAIDWEAVQVD